MLFYYHLKIFLFLLSFKIIYVQLSVVKLHLVRDWGLIAVPVAPCVQVFVIKWPVALRAELCAIDGPITPCGQLRSQLHLMCNYT